MCNLCDNAAFPRSNKEFSSGVNSETSRMAHVKMKGGSNQEEAERGGLRRAASGSACFAGGGKICSG